MTLPKECSINTLLSPVGAGQKRSLADAMTPARQVIDAITVPLPESVVGSRPTNSQSVERQAPRTLQGRRAVLACSLSRDVPF